jgi:hypothetical protein
MDLPDNLNVVVIQKSPRLCIVHGEAMVNGVKHQHDVEVNLLERVGDVHRVLDDGVNELKKHFANLKLRGTDEERSARLSEKQRNENFEYWAKRQNIQLPEGFLIPRGVDEYFMTLIKQIILENRRLESRVAELEGYVYKE